jgi:hypothetical protein
MLQLIGKILVPCGVLCTLIKKSIDKEVNHAFDFTIPQISFEKSCVFHSNEPKLGLRPADEKLKTLIIVNRS